MALLEDIQKSVVDGDEDLLQKQVQQAIDEKINPDAIINEGLIGGMNIVAPLFRDGEMFIPEVMESAAAMNKGIEMVKPLMEEDSVEKKGKVVIGTVQGDLHDIGKNLVKLMLESSGYDVIDLGSDVRGEVFLEAIKEHKPDIVGMSSLLTTTMMRMQDTINDLINGGVRDSVKIIIGGAPISQDFADEIGADGYSEDAAEAVELCANLIATAGVER